ncbi:ATP-dependent DNA helicase [Endothiovibrio diazotrophicus]
MESVSEIFGAEGPLAKSLDGYAPRPQQVEMAEAVERALADNGVLISEAGTGTGKTYAYLVPAIRSGRKVVISTGTKTLQDQLFHRDLPKVMEALACQPRTALLKGRANYLCPYRLDRTLEEGRLPSRELAHELTKVNEWRGRTASGDVGEAGIPEDAEILPRVTSTADNCLGQECPDLAKCFVLNARRKAQEAELVVVNHHLLLADMALKEEGFGEVLPDCDAFILDEAHQLPEIAANFFGLSLSSRQLLDLAKDTVTEQMKDAKEMDKLAESAYKLETAVRNFRLAFGTDPKRAPWAEVCDQSEVKETLEKLTARLDELTGQLEVAAPRAKGLENCWDRAQALVERLARVSGVGEAEGEWVHWYETFTRAFSLNRTPLDVAVPFRGQMAERKRAWIFTSATLAVGEGFDHFAHRLGLEPTETLRLDSPFDFRHHALLYCPTEMPDPNDPRYTATVVERAVPVIEASGGSAFLLFTSYRALREARGLLEERIEFPLLTQGDAPRGELLARFRKLGNAVLLGTQSFWEGVDVRGEALTCVIIDKLPFASPGDPVLQARIDSLKRSGGNPFMEYQLPNAVITLKQGVGRLIRDMDDYGTLMLCDPRLFTRSYGGLFVGSLPNMPKTRKIEVVQRFFAQWD